MLQTQRGLQLTVGRIVHHFPLHGLVHAHVGHAHLNSTRVIARSVCRRRVGLQLLQEVHGGHSEQGLHVDLGDVTGRRHGKDRGFGKDGKWVCQKCATSNICSEILNKKTFPFIKTFSKSQKSQLTDSTWVYQRRR